MKSLFAELLFSLRLLRNAPGFAVTVIAVLALGAGANTAIFSVIRAVLLHPFPYTEPDRIVFAGSTREGEEGRMPVTYPDFLDWQKQAQRFEQLSYARGRPVTLTQVAEPAVLRAAFVSDSAWPLLGVPPLRGRTFTAEENRPGANRICVLAHATWQGRFGGDPDIVGRTITLDGMSYMVIGVMPPRFKFWAADVWAPVGLEADTEMLRSRVLRMDAWAVGKLKPGVTLEEAEAEINVIAARLAEQYPDSNKGVGAALSLLSESVTGPLRDPLFVLLAAVGFVLLIACANVANLLLARSATRQREFAIRSALGAARTQLIRQMLVEVLPLAVLGTIAGVLIGWWGLQSLLALMPPQGIPAEAEVEVDATVLLITLTVCVGTMLVFTLLPALETSRTPSTTALQEGGTRSSGSLRTSRMRAALIVAEVGLSLILLVGAGLLLRSFMRLQSENPGFNPDRLLVTTLQLPDTRYRSGVQATEFFRELVTRVRVLPGVKAAAAAGNAPFFSGSDLPLLTPERTYSELSDLESVQFNVVLGDYFAAQGLRLVAGRTFTEADGAGAEPVIVLNETAVKRFLPDGVDPLNQRVMLGLPPNLISPGLLPAGLDTFQWTRVIGVVESARHFGLQSDPPPAAYLPVDQSWRSTILRNNMFLLLRTEADPMLVAADVRAIVRSLDPDQPVGRITTMETVIGESLRHWRFSTVLLGLFAGVAFALAIVGIYGVVAWNVTQRTRELGIRAALGATQNDMLGLVVRQGMRVVLLGLVIGIAVSLALTRLLQRLLYETSPFDPWTFAAVGTVLAGVALLACVVPALRASRVSPLEALRAE